MAPEWSDFKVVLALSRAGSIAGAARELQVDHSTISRRLAALEDVLKVKLLIRGGREFSWTQEGRAVVEASESMESAVATALRALRTSKVDIEGSVRVSVAPAFVHWLMRLMLPALREAHPLLKLELQGSFARADLAKGEADIALRMNRPSEPDLVARKAVEAGWYAYASQSYIDAHGSPERHEDLAKHALILYAEVLHQAPPTRWLESYKAVARSTMRMDSVESAAQAAAAHAGIAVLPAFFADTVPELRRVFPEPVCTHTGWVVYHDCVRDNIRVKIVADALLDFFKRHEAIYSGARTAP